MEKSGIVVQLFVVTTIMAVLQQGQHIDFRNTSYSLISYALSFLLFCMKYFIDDLLVNDESSEGNQLRPENLFIEVTAWVLMLNSSIYMMHGDKVFISSLCWLLATLVMTLELLRRQNGNVAQRKGNRVRIWVFQNIVISVLLACICFRFSLVIMPFALLLFVFVSCFVSMGQRSS